MKYISKKDDKRIVELINKDEKFGTVTIQYTDDASTKKISLGTLKRWFRRIDESADVQNIAAETVTDDSKDAIVSIELNDDSVCADGTAYAEIGKEIAENAKKKADKAAKKPSKKAEKKADSEKIDTIGIVETIAKKLNLSYKRSRDGIGIFNSEDKRVLDFWKRSTRVRVYIASANDRYKAIVKSGLIDNLHDNPSKSSKLDKSFYVAADNIEKLLVLFTK